MSRCINGHIRALQNLKRSHDAAARAKEEDLLETIFLTNGKLYGILSIQKSVMTWEVFTDAHFSQHADWNDPACMPYKKATDPLRRLSPLHFVSQLIEKGWRELPTVRG